MFLLRVLVLSLGLLPSLVWAAAAPEYGAWTWPVALDYVNNAAETIGSTCRAWVEKYSTNSYRMWKRCGVNATGSGVRLVDYTFSRADSGTISNYFNCGANGCRKYDKDGAGAVVQTANNPPSGSSFNNDAPSVTFSGGLLDWGHPGKLRHNDFQRTCTGGVVAGGNVNELLGDNVLRWSLLGLYVRDTSAAVNTVSATCKNADVLVQDFGPVASNCTATGVITARIGGSASMAADCGCIPVGQGLDPSSTPNVCIYRPITGDPAGLGADTAPVGSGVTAPGATFTNADLAEFTSGDAGMPVSGSNAGGGVADGYGFSGASGTVGTASSPPGTGFTSGSGGGGPAPGTGSGNCAGGAVNCNDNGSPDIGFVPGLPTYDTAFTSPAQGDWVGSINTFLSGSPIVSAISGSSVTATGSECSFAGSAYGKPFAFNFCPYSGALAAVGSLLIALAHLAAFFIMWKS